VWVANQYAGTVSQVDPATDTIAHTLTVGNRPQALAAAGGLVWIAAQPAPTRHRGGTLTILSDVWPNTIDPALASLAAGVEELNNDGLIAYRRVGGTASTQLVPDLAVSLPSPTDGGTTYTFQLRRGIHYSNGQVVRPEDFRRALERDLIVGPNGGNGGPFAQVIGGAACAEHPSGCDLSRGVVTDDVAYTVTFHLVAPNPEFLARLTLPDAIAVPAGTPDHDLGMHCPPATGPYECAVVGQRLGVEVRNPYFHEWSHAARPDGYPDRIVFRLASSPEAEVSAVERGTADNGNDGVPPDRLNEVRTRFASQLHVHPAVATNALILNTHTPPFNDIRVRRALNYAMDRAKVARLLGQDSHPTCQLLPPYLPGYQRYCPYTLHPNAAGTWQAPNLAEAERLTAASHTRGTPITIWELGAWQTDYGAIKPYLVTLLARLGYPTRFENVANAPDGPLRFADSRTGAQAALGGFSVWWPSASQIIQRNFACQSFIPHSTGNSNLSEFCDPRLDAQIRTALAAESDNSPNAPALWTRTDRTVTDEAPVVPLTTPSVIDFVSARAGNYQYSFQQEMLWDQLWVR
jgi:peptide/nickel transport system substrate-binding protein